MPVRLAITIFTNWRTIAKWALAGCLLFLLPAQTWARGWQFLLIPLASIGLMHLLDALLFTLDMRSRYGPSHEKNLAKVLAPLVYARDLLEAGLLVNQGLGTEDDRANVHARMLKLHGELARLVQDIAKADIQAMYGAADTRR